MTAQPLLFKKTKVCSGRKEGFLTYCANVADAAIKARCVCFRMEIMECGCSLRDQKFGCQ